MRAMWVAVMLGMMVGAKAQVPVAGPSFEVATIKASDPSDPGRGMGWEGRRFHSHYTMSQIMQFAYNVQAKQILGEPGWFNTELFDIEAQAQDGEPTPAEWRVMMQQFLTERLQMKLHHEQKVMSAYVLTVASGGPKFAAAKEEDAQGFKDVVRIQRGPHMWLRVVGANGTMAQLAAEIQRVEMDRPVVDKTGLTGRYSFSMTATSIKPFFAGETADTSENAPAELFTAIREQLGLKLEPTKTAVDCLVLDGVSKPVLD